jgi:hypothetical protein
MTTLRTTVRVAATSLLGVSALAVSPSTALAAGPPAAATAFVTQVITPDGGSVSGFGITAAFAKGAVSTPRLIILGNWPNGLDVTPPAGATAVKTYGLQECDTDFTHCTSALGNFLAKDSKVPGGSRVSASPAGSEKIKGQTVPYEAGHPIPNYDGSVTPTLVHGNTNFGTKVNKLVTITTETAADTVLLYNANADNTTDAYDTLLSNRIVDGIVFKTFQPVVWTLTAPSS